VIALLSSEVFNAKDVKVIEFEDGDSVYEQIKNDKTSILVLKATYMRKNIFNDIKWFPYLTRIVIVDDSPESRSTNTSLVFAFHNKIINTLNKVHTKKLGALANTQLNLRLILDKVNDENLEKFRLCAEKKIADYEEELKEFKKEQLGETTNLKKISRYINSTTMRSISSRINTPSRSFTITLFLFNNARILKDYRN